MITLNDETVNVTIFPDKTSQVWKLTEDQIRYIINNGHVEVHWKFESESEVFHLIQLADLINHIYYTNNFEHLKGIRLIAPYLPYARQDKGIDNERTFALHSFVGMMGEYYDVVESLDVHPTNHKDIGLIKNIFPTKQIDYVINDCKADVVCYPDKGAKTRYSYHISLPECVLNKVRNQLTGEITGLEFEYAPPILTDQSILILDDLCDGGRTFVESAKLLKQFGPSSINLYTTHGLYTKGIEVLYDSGIDKIYNKDGLIQ